VLLESEDNVRCIFQRVRNSRPAFFDKLDLIVPKHSAHSDSGGIMVFIISWPSPNST
jgi:SpoVK/Ycf46/Vps4 family AAA+-type ATPase